MEESSILSFKILFLDTTENGPLMLQEFFFILSRLNFFSPPFHKKKKKIRERKREQDKASKTPPVFWGTKIPFDHIRTTSGKVHTRLGIFCRWSHNQLKPKKLTRHPVFTSTAKIPALTWSWASKPAHPCQMPRQVVLLSTDSSSVTWSFLYYCGLGWTHHRLEHQQTTLKAPNKPFPPQPLFCICDSGICCRSAHPEICFNKISAYYMWSQLLTSHKPSLKAILGLPMKSPWSPC